MYINNFHPDKLGYGFRVEFLNLLVDDNEFYQNRFEEIFNIVVDST